MILLNKHAFIELKKFFRELMFPRRKSFEGLLETVIDLTDSGGAIKLVYFRRSLIKDDIYKL